MSGVYPKLNETKKYQRWELALFSVRLAVVDREPTHTDNHLALTAAVIRSWTKDFKLKEKEYAQKVGVPKDKLIKNFYARDPYYSKHPQVAKRHQEEYERYIFSTDMLELTIDPLEDAGITRLNPELQEQYAKIDPGLYISFVYDFIELFQNSSDTQIRNGISLKALRYAAKFARKHLTKRGRHGRPSNAEYATQIVRDLYRISKEHGIKLLK